MAASLKEDNLKLTSIRPAGAPSLAQWVANFNPADCAPLALQTKASVVGVTVRGARRLPEAGSNSKYPAEEDPKRATCYSRSCRSAYVQNVRPQSLHRARQCRRGRAEKSILAQQSQAAWRPVCALRAGKRKLRTGEVFVTGAVAAEAGKLSGASPEGAMANVMQCIHVVK